MDYGIIDITTRSRETLLNMLELSGYNTEPYRKFSPKEIEQMIGENQLGGSLRMDLTRRDETSSQYEKCLVIYRFQRMKQKLVSLMNELIPVVQEGEETEKQKATTTDIPKVDPKTTEVIVVLFEPIVEVFHTASLLQWKKNQLKIRFFEAKKAVNDPTQFAIVPKHEKISSEEVKHIMKELYVQSKAQFPIIRFHEDMQARWLGLVPGDVVKITRSSPSAGEYIVYRVCAP
jgi:DNA-directed RNA polymerase subunit H